MIDDTIRPYHRALTDCHSRTNDDVLAEPGATSDSDRLYSRDALIHDRGPRTLEGVPVVRDVDVPCEEHAILDDHLLSRRQNAIARHGDTVANA